MPVHVEVAAPDLITLKASHDADQEWLVEVATGMDGSLGMTVKSLTKDKEGATDSEETEKALAQLGHKCHSLPLLLYYALKPSLQTRIKTETPYAAGADANSAIEPIEDDMAANMKLDADEMLLDDMGMF